MDSKTKLNTRLFAVFIGLLFLPSVFAKHQEDRRQNATLKKQVGNRPIGEKPLGERSIGVENPNLSVMHPKSLFSKNNEVELFLDTSSNERIYSKLFSKPKPNILNADLSFETTLSLPSKSSLQQNLKYQEFDSLSTTNKYLLISEYLHKLNELNRINDTSILEYFYGNDLVSYKYAWSYEKIDRLFETGKYKDYDILLAEIELSKIKNDRETHSVIFEKINRLNNPLIKCILMAQYNEHINASFSTATFESLLNSIWGKCNEDSKQILQEAALKFVEYNTEKQWRICLDNYLNSNNYESLYRIVKGYYERYNLTRQAANYESTKKTLGEFKLQNSKLVSTNQAILNLNCLEVLSVEISLYNLSNGEEREELGRAILSKISSYLPYRDESHLLSSYFELAKFINLVSCFLSYNKDNITALEAEKLHAWISQRSKPFWGITALQNLSLYALNANLSNAFVSYNNLVKFLTHESNASEYFRAINKEAIGLMRYNLGEAEDLLLRSLNDPTLNTNSTKKLLAANLVSLYEKKKDYKRALQYQKLINQYNDDFSIAYESKLNEGKEYDLETSHLQEVYQLQLRFNDSLRKKNNELGAANTELYTSKRKIDTLYESLKKSYQQLEDSAKVTIAERDSANKYKNYANFAAFIAIILLFISIKANVKLKKEQQEKDIAFEKLQAEKGLKEEAYQKLEKEQEAKENYRLQLHQNALNAHHFKGLKYGIQLIEDEEYAVLTKVLDATNKFAKALFDSIKGEYSTLKKEVDLMEQYFWMERHYELYSEYDLKIDKQLVEEFKDIQVPSNLFIAFLENTFKYSRIKDTKGSIIDFRLEKMDNNLEISIVDNGPKYEVNPIRENSSSDIVGKICKQFRHNKIIFSPYTIINENGVTKGGVKFLIKL